MSVESFLDTNIFIYHLESTDERKFEIAERIIRDGVVTGNACISSQVVQECLNVMLRKTAERPLASAAARQYLDGVLSPLYRVPASLNLYRQGLELHDRYGFAFYDALIVAGALDAGCTRLWSEDLQDGQRVGRLTIENPFREQGPPLRKPARECSQKKARNHALSRRDSGPRTSPTSRG